MEQFQQDYRPRLRDFSISRMRSSKSSISLLSRGLSVTNYTPPIGFAYIEDSIVRCLQPILPQHMPFLSSLSITSIINLSDFVSSYFDTFVEENSIDLHNIDPNRPFHTDSSTSSSSHSENILNDVGGMSDWVRNVLELLVPLSVKPCVLIIGNPYNYMDCVTIACLRKVQQWSLPSVLSEFRLLAGAKGILELRDLEQFIDIFNAHIEIPADYADAFQRENLLRFPDFLRSHYEISERERILFEGSRSDVQMLSEKDLILARLLFHDKSKLITNRVKYDAEISLLADEEED